MEKIEVKIETVDEKPLKISPLVGYFPSGFDPWSVKRNESDSPVMQQPRVRVFRNVNRMNRLELVVSPNSYPVDFVGTSYTGEATAPQVSTYALGVLDKATKVLKIVSIASNKVLVLYLFIFVD